MTTALELHHLNALSTFVYSGLCAVNKVLCRHTWARSFCIKFSIAGHADALERLLYAHYEMFTISPYYASSWEPFV
jgi:hypothetical protein